jgi:hypothetical protein
VVNGSVLMKWYWLCILHPCGCCCYLQVKLTLLLTWDSSGKPDLFCHAEPLPARPTQPVKLQVK